MDDICYAVKDENGFYWCGYNKWENQIRKAKLFHSLKYANEIVIRYQNKNPITVKVRIMEES